MSTYEQRNGIAPFLLVSSLKLKFILQIFYILQIYRFDEVNRNKNFERFFFRVKGFSEF